MKFLIPVHNITDLNITPIFDIRIAVFYFVIMIAGLITI